MARLDRDRIGALGRFLLQRFLDDRCFETAGALSYTTLFALVPLTAAVLAILSAFPVFGQWSAALTDFIFDNFVPAAAKIVQGYLTQFAGNASKATLVGILVLLISSLLMMSSIEDAYNRIWRVPTARRSFARFLVYWTALTLGPLLIAAALAFSSLLFALPLLSAAEEQYGLRERLLVALPFLLIWFGVALSYMVIPNRSVLWRHAAIGALLAALLFEGAKRAFALYVTEFTSYQQVYGAIAVAPIFLVWVYLSWVVILLGASLAATLAAFDYRPHARRLPRDQEFLGLLSVLAEFVAAQRIGAGLQSHTLCKRLDFLTDDLLQRYLRDLLRAGVIQRSEPGAWVLVRALDSVTLLDLYEAGHYRLPVTGAIVESVAAGAGTEAIARVAKELERGLALPLSEIFPPPARSEPVDPAKSKEPQ